MKKTLAVLAAGSLAFLALPAHATYVCPAPYPGDPAYDAKYIAYVACETDNYNEQQCYLLASASTNPKWNETDHECIISCNAGYYASVDNKTHLTTCKGSGPAAPAATTVVATPPPVVTAPVTTVTTVTPAAVPPAPIVAPAVKAAPKPAAKAAAQVQVSVPAIATATPAAMETPAVVAESSPAVPQKLSLWQKIAGFFKDLFGG